MNNEYLDYRIMKVSEEIRKFSSYLDKCGTDEAKELKSVIDCMEDEKRLYEIVLGRGRKK